jgi:galactoside 2-L-fucosyltransferase 1/2
MSTVPAGKKGAALILALCVITTVTYAGFLFKFSPPRSFTPESFRHWWNSFPSLRPAANWTAILNNSASSAGPIDLLDLPPEPDSVNKSGRYVSACQWIFDGRRTGNQLSNFAAMLHVARLTGRRVAMPRQVPGGWIDRWFQVSITRVDDIEKELCPCTIINEARELSFEKSMPALPNRTDLRGKSLLTCGNFQSWKYTFGVEAQLRRHLRPHASISTAVKSFFDSLRPRRWLRNHTYVKVGIHVRAGDTKRLFGFGFTIPKQPYFTQAMINVTYDTPLDGDKRRIQFFVTSDSIQWVKETLNLTSIGSRLNSSTTDVEVTYSIDHSQGFDLIMLTMCDVVIMTTGTYGWWGAWLSNAKKVIYYYNWPRPSSRLEELFAREDYYPPYWISFKGPYFEL